MAIIKFILVVLITFLRCLGEIVAGLLVGIIIFLVVCLIAANEEVLPPPPEPSPARTLDLSGFAMLPIELQIMIWDEVAALDRGCIEICWDIFDPLRRLAPTDRKPLIFSICRLSRSRSPHAFSSLSMNPDSRITAPLRFSPRGDAVRLWEVPDVTDHATRTNVPLMLSSFGREFAFIERLELDCAPLDYCDVRRAFAPFIRLRTITIRLHGSNRNYFLDDRPVWEANLRAAWVDTINPARAAASPTPLRPVAAPLVLYRARDSTRPEYIALDHVIESLSDSPLVRLFDENPAQVVPGAFPVDDETNHEFLETENATLAVEEEPEQQEVQHQQRLRSRLPTANTVGKWALFGVAQYLFWSSLFPS